MEWILDNAFIIIILLFYFLNYFTKLKKKDSNEVGGKVNKEDDMMDDEEAIREEIRRLISANQEKEEGVGEDFITEEQEKVVLFEKKPEVVEDNKVALLESEVARQKNLLSEYEDIKQTKKQSNRTFPGQLSENKHIIKNFNDQKFLRQAIIMKAILDRPKLRIGSKK